MPLPLAPVPGKSLFGGGWSKAYQKFGGKYSAAALALGARTAVRFMVFPGWPFTFGESTRPYPRTQTSYVAFGRSGITYCPRSLVTTIFANVVGRSRVSAITHTPASGP